MGTNSNATKRVSPQKNKTDSKNTEENKSKKLKIDVPESDEKKKIWSFDALVEVMQPTVEELEYREEKARESNFVQKYSKLFKCTKCQCSIKAIVVNHEKVPVHPCLGVLMCQKCCNYYEDGEFSLDSDGEDKYCRWCGEGGTIFGCSKCICGFCAACIKQHFKRDYFREVQKDEDWLCFFCNPKPLWNLRFICSLAIKMSESSLGCIKTDKENVKQTEDTDNNIQQDQENEVRSPQRRKRFTSLRKDLGESSPELKDFSFTTSGKNRSQSTYTPSTEESESESESELESERPVKRVKYAVPKPEGRKNKVEADSFENRKANVLKELKKILTLSEHQMEFGVTWSRKMLEKVATPDHITTNAQLAKECQKVKHFLSLVSTFLVQFSNSVDSIEKTLGKNDGKIVRRDSVKDQSAYTNILQFLSFVRGQVKAFMEKGISLSDVFDAEVYDDDKIIGIKKKSSIATSREDKNEPLVTSSCSSSSSKSNYGAENSQQNRIDELAKIRDDDILELVAHQTLQKDFDMDDEYDFKDQDSSNTTLGDLSVIKNTPDTKDDIRDILAVLENA